MPRSPTVYTLPAGTTVAPNTTIESSWANALTADIAQTFNTVQPLVYGGTGAATAGSAADALSPDFANVASGATTNIGAATSPNVNITGTTTITAFDTVTAGIKRFAKFAGALTLTHNGTSLILPGAANITTAAGDTAIFVSEGSGNWRCLDYQKAASPPFSFASGSWTPGLLFGGNNSGMTISSQTGIYVKIGTLVVVQFTLALSAKGVSTGAATIPNLPFTPSASVVNGSAAAFLNDGGFTGLTAGILFSVVPSNTALALRLPRTTGTGSVTDANFTDAASLGGTVVYIAAS